MLEENKTLEERMTPEERELYESFKSKIGQEFVPEPSHEMFFPLLNEEPVTWSRIKKWAKVNEDLNPLWFDEEYAKNSRWGGIVAPPLFLMTIDAGTGPVTYFVGKLYTPAPNAVLKLEKYRTFRGAMQTDSEWEFFKPVRPGDKIFPKATCTDIFWKQGKRFRLLFTSGVTTYTNQKGQLLACCRTGAVYMFK